MRRSSIDIGTNSVRLLVADTSIRPPKSLATELRITRLGRKLDETGVISEESAAATIAAVANFALIARAHETEPIVFGTAALREATNGADVSARITDAAGVEVQIITGDLEALITFRGALIGMTECRETMVLDIGGGSTEFITLRDDHRDAGNEVRASDIRATSMKLGSVRQTERHILSDPPSRAEITSLEEEVAGIVKEGIDGRIPARLCGVAGSVTQVAALELKMDRYDAARINGFFLPFDRIDAWIDTFSKTTVEERRNLLGMVPQRAETVLAGTVILRETVKRLGLDGVHVSDYDSLWGSLDGIA